MDSDISMGLDSSIGMDMDMGLGVGESRILRTVLLVPGLVMVLCTPLKSFS